MTTTPWQCMDTGASPGAANMEFDERLVRRLQMGAGGQVLRLYRWRPWAISVGYHQGVAELDAARCARDGIDLVRRPTGGRAILHAEELTYSVVMIAGRRSVHQAYHEISKALVRGLALFGVETRLQRSQPNFPALYRHASSIPCFTSSARYEIEWQGKKIVGSAQRRYADGEHDVVLQHGSILCGPAHRRLVEYLALPDEELAGRIRAELTERTTDLQNITGTAVDYTRLTDCIRRGFEEEWETAFEPVREHDILIYDSHA